MYMCYETWHIISVQDLAIFVIITDIISSDTGEIPITLGWQRQRNEQR